MRSVGGARVGIALLLAAVAFLGYFFNTSKNPLTGEKQHVGGITVENEIQLGLHARDEMAAQFGGLDPDPRLDQLVDEVGQRLVQKTVASKSDWKFEFHVLDDPQTINAFALP